MNGKIEWCFEQNLPFKNCVCKHWLCHTLRFHVAVWPLTSRVLSFLDGPGQEQGCWWCLLLQQDVGEHEASGRPKKGVWLMKRKPLGWDIPWAILCYCWSGGLCIICKLSLQLREDVLTAKDPKIRTPLVASIRRTYWLCWQGNYLVLKSERYLHPLGPKAGAAILPTSIVTKTWDPFRGPSQGHLSGIACDSGMSLTGDCQLRMWAYQHIVLRGPTPREKWELIWRVLLSWQLILHFFKSPLLRCNLSTMKCTHFKCTVKGFGKYIYTHVTITTIKTQNIFIALRNAFMPFTLRAPHS